MHVGNFMGVKIPVSKVLFPGDLVSSSFPPCLSQRRHHYPAWPATVGRRWQQGSRGYCWLTAGCFVSGQSSCPAGRMGLIKTDTQLFCHRTKAAYIFLNLTNRTGIYTCHKCATAHLLFAVSEIPCICLPQSWTESLSTVQPYSSARIHTSPAYAVGAMRTCEAYTGGSRTVFSRRLLSIKPLNTCKMHNHV